MQPRHAQHSSSRLLRRSTGEPFIMQKLQRYKSYEFLYDFVKKLASNTMNFWFDIWKDSIGSCQNNDRIIRVTTVFFYSPLLSKTTTETGSLFYSFAPPTDGSRYIPYIDQRLVKKCMYIYPATAIFFYFFIAQCNILLLIV